MFMEGWCFVQMRSFKPDRDCDSLSVRKKRSLKDWMPLVTMWPDRQHFSVIAWWLGYGYYHHSLSSPHGWGCYLPWINTTPPAGPGGFITTKGERPFFNILSPFTWKHEASSLFNQMGDSGHIAMGLDRIYRPMAKRVSGEDHCLCLCLCLKSVILCSQTGQGCLIIFCRTFHPECMEIQGGTCRWELQSCCSTPHQAIKPLLCSFIKNCLGRASETKTTRRACFTSIHKSFYHWHL